MINDAKKFAEEDAETMNEKNKKNKCHYEEKKTRDCFFKAMPSQESSKNKFT